MTKRGPTVGIRTLKNEASGIIRRVRAGETLTITDRGEPVALLVPITSAPSEESVRKLVAAGRLSWGGGKPSGAARRVRARGPSVSSAVLEDRR